MKVTLIASVSANGRNNLMTIPINKDPDTEYKNEFMFGYTLKEVLCVAAALLIIAGVTALVYFKFNIALNVGCYFGIPLAFPVIFLGFKEWYGMSITRFKVNLAMRKKPGSLHLMQTSLKNTSHRLH